MATRSPSINSLSFRLIYKASYDRLDPKREGFGYLPTNILIKIFSYFTEKEIRKHIVPVCQQWRAAAEHPSLWKKLEFRGMNINTNLICDKVWLFRHVETISIRNILEPVTVLRQIARCCQNVTHLTLRHCPEILEDSLRHLVFSCRQLKVLDLKGTPFKSLILQEELTSCPNLYKINFSDNPYLAIPQMIAIVVNCRNLTEFHLSSCKARTDCQLNDTDCYFILTRMVQNLKALTLDCSSLSSMSFISIMRCRKLEHLCLNYAYNFNGNDFQDMWKNLNQLITLKIRFGHQIADLNFVHLFSDGCEVMRKLQAVDFTGCSKLSNGGVEMMGKYCTNLKSVVLRSCKNVLCLEPIMKNCTELEVLNVAFCTFAKYTGLSIPPKLKYLYISDNAKHTSFKKNVKQRLKYVVVMLCIHEFNKKCILSPYMYFY